MNSWGERVAVGSLVITSLLAPASLAIQSIGIAVAVIAWGCARVFGRQAPIQTAATVPLLLWFLAGMISLVHSVALATSLRGLFKILKVIAVVLMTADLMRSKRRITALVAAAMIGAAIVSLDDLIQVLWGTDLLHHDPAGMGPGGIRRLSATFHHGNDFAVYAVTMLPVCLAAALGARTVKYRLWTGFVVGMLGLALALSLSRSGAVSISVSLLVFCILRKAWRTLAVLSLLAVVAAWNLPAPLRQWILSQPSWLEALVQPLRLEIWQAALKMIADHPWIGIGVNTFTLNYATYKIPSDTLQAAYAHNQYLHLTAELGVVGLAAFGFLLVRTFAAWRQVLHDPNSWTRTIAVGLGCGLLGVLTIGLFESALYSARTSFFFWLWFGVLHGMAASLRPTS